LYDDESLGGIVKEGKCEKITRRFKQSQSLFKQQKIITQKHNSKASQVQTPKSQA
jgi:hypothetical protein